MFRVFINYRTGDGEASAALIDRELSRRFGSDKIFRASKAIPPGEDFERAILRAVRRSDVLLAVIGLHWLGVRDGQGRRAIDNPNDWTRREIEEAFAHGVTVVPVLVGRLTEPLSKDDLPPDLTRLARCQYLRLDHRNAEADLDRLARELKKLVPGLRDRDAPGDNGSRDNGSHDNGSHDNSSGDGGSGGSGGPGNGTVSNQFHGPVDARHGVIGIANFAGPAGA